MFYAIIGTKFISPNHIASVICKNNILEIYEYSHNNLPTNEGFSAIKIPTLNIAATTSDKYIAIQRSFIPNFEKIVSDMLQALVHKIPTPASITFDPNNLHLNFVEYGSQSNFHPHIMEYGYQSNNKMVGIYYPCDQRLLAAINTLNKESLKSSSSLLLADAYFLYHYHLSQLPGDKILQNKKCQFILPYISKKLVTIYNLEKEIVKNKNHAVNSDSLWEL